ncbi:MAG: hypothetical protein J6031_02610, partial [Bacteroidales bacterium]|nr:hypothetical protein [Bacteroidales bacterium]
ELMTETRKLELFSENKVVTFCFQLFFPSSFECKNTHFFHTAKIFLMFFACNQKKCCNFAVHYKTIKTDANI